MFLILHDPENFLKFFRKIQIGIYDAPDDFVIIDDGSNTFEPALQELWVALDRQITGALKFSLKEIYTVLQDSKDFDRICKIFEVRYGLTQTLTENYMRSHRMGIYPVPEDLLIMRTNRQAHIGGYSYRLLRKREHSDCQHAISHHKSWEELRLAEIYTGLWALNRTQEEAFKGMRTILGTWLQDSDFCATEEGMLTRLALKLGCAINAKGLSELLEHRIAQGSYILTQLLPYGVVEGESLWCAKCHFQGSVVWYRPHATLHRMASALC